jgi:hypothetical protein
MPNWFKRQLPDNEEQKSRYTFSINGDIFVEKGAEGTEERLINSLENIGGVRVNSCDVQPFEKVF